MPSYTTNYSIPKPTVNGDATTWGTYLNSGMDIIDTNLKSVSNTASAALPLAGGTLTGALNGTTAAFSGAVTGASYSGGAISGTTGTFSSNATVGGTFGVTGATTLTGGLTSPNWVLNSGNSLYIYDAGSNVLGFRSGTTGAPKYVNIDATGTLNILNGGLFVQSNSSMSGTLGVSGAITANGGAIVAGGNITGSANSSSYSVAGGASYSNGGAIQFFGSAAAGSPGTIQFLTGTGGTNAIVGSFAANGTFNVVNNVTVGGTLGVTGAATFSSSVSASSFSGAGTGLTGTAGSLSIGGNAATATSATTATTATNQSGGTINATSGTVSGALSAGSFAGTALASAAQTLTGSSTTQAITPAGFSGNSSIGANGYYKLPGGLIVQWGNTGAISASSTATVTYPVAFTTVYSVQATKLLASGNVNDACNVVNVGTAQFQVSNGGTAASNAYWLAIGV